MNSKTWKAMLAILLGAMLTLSAGWNVSATPERNFELQGTWLVMVTQTNCDTGAVLIAFPSILTFADGGTMTEDTANPAFAPGQRGGGQGHWHYEGGGTFWAKSVALIKSDTPIPPTAVPTMPLFKKGKQIITQTIQFAQDEPDSWTSNATVEFLDAATGAPYAPSPVHACVTAAAVRFK